MHGSLNQQTAAAINMIQSGQVEEGLALLKQIMQYSEDNPDLLYELADAFYELGHVETALSLIGQMEAYFDEITTDMQIEARILRTEIYIDLGDLDQAMNELLNCRELEPDNTRIMVLLADIYLMQDLPEVACRYLEEVLEEEPELDDVRFILGKIYMDTGAQDAAVKHWNRLSDNTYDDQIHLYRAKTLSHSGKFEEALELFRDCLESDPTDEALLGCALTSLQLNLPEEAAQYSEQLLERDPEHTGAYLVLSDACRNLGDYEEALAVLERALAFNNQEEAVILKLIELCYDMGRNNEAMEYTEVLLSLDDENETGLDWKRRLSEQTL